MRETASEQGFQPVFRLMSPEKKNVRYARQLKLGGAVELPSRSVVAQYKCVEGWW